MEPRLAEDEGGAPTTGEPPPPVDDLRDRGDEEQAAAPVGTPSTPRSLDASEDDEVGESRLHKEPSVALYRKVVEVALDEDDAQCCSICLDDFTVEDPANVTTCG